MPSILGSEKNSKFSFNIKKIIYFFKKSSISFLSNALDNESIGCKCLTLLNLFDGFELQQFFQLSLNLF